MLGMILISIRYQNNGQQVSQILEDDSSQQLDGTGMVSTYVVRPVGILINKVNCIIDFLQSCAMRTRLLLDVSRQVCSLDSSGSNCYFMSDLRLVR